MRKKLLQLATLALLFTGVASAQTTGSITGVVTDGSSGKPVIGAVVVATSPAAPGEQTAVTDAKGAFTIANLPAGKYTLQASIEGYKPETRSDLVLGENVTLRANLAVVPDTVQLEEVVVTGSRIRRKDLTTPAPVTLLSRETLQQSGKVSIGDFLQTLPEQGNAVNTAVNNGGDGSVRVSLRSLGDSRTLVLVNGRRMVASGGGADDSVDLSTIPASVVERVEILKDGGSTLYGSDAIGGVINFITKKNWNGSDASVYMGTSSRGDGTTLDISAATGASGERGNILFAAGYYNQKSVMAGDRSFSEKQVYFDATGMNSLDGVGEFFSGSSRTPGGRIRANGTGNAAYAALLSDPDYQDRWSGIPGSAYLIHDSTLTASTPAVAACIAAGGTLADCQWRPMNTASMAPQGDLYNFAPVNYLVTPAERINLWTSGDTRLGELSRAYFEASLTNRKSKIQLAPEPLIIGAGGVTDAGGNLVAVAADNVYNPFGKAFSNLSRRLDEFGPRTHEFNIDTYRVVAGLDGSLSDAFGPLRGWAWDASYNYGATAGTYVLGGSLQSSKLADAIGSSFRLPNGTAVCGTPGADGVAGTTDDDIKSGCVPLDLFHGSGSITPDQVAYLGYVGTSKGANMMQAWQANMSGEMFKIPTAQRATGLALGVERRTVSGSFINDPLAAKFDSTNGGSYDTRGEYNVTEGYAELSLPLAGGMVGVEDLEATLSARAFNYSNFGKDWTYKLGARYTPVRGVTVRGTYSTAFRAPSIPDLFSGQFDNFPSVSDPCAIPATPEIAARCGVAAGNGDDSTQLRSTNGGNPDLKPETAKIFTVGLVYEPSYVKNFSATLDYYRVKVDQAIATIGESTILAGCYTTGNQPQYCSLIERDPASQNITRITNLNSNVGGEEVAGIDLALRYFVPAERIGRFDLRFDGTWLQKHNQTLADGTVVIGKNTFDVQSSSGQGGTNAAFKFNAGATWTLEGLTAGLSTRFISAFKECGDSTGTFAGQGLCYVDDTYQHRVKAYNTYDVFFAYNLKSIAGKTTLLVGVNNAFDAKPVNIYNGFASHTDQYTYDQMGRFYYARLSQSY